MSCNGPFKECAEKMGGSGVPAGGVTAVFANAHPLIKTDAMYRTYQQHGGAGLAALLTRDLSEYVPADLLLKAYYDGYETEAMAEHPNLPEEAVLQMVESEKPEVRAGVARRNDASTDLLSMLHNGPDDNVRYAAWENPNVQPTEADYMNALRAGDVAKLNGIGNNTSTSDPVVVRLSQSVGMLANWDVNGLLGRSDLPEAAVRNLANYPGVNAYLILNQENVPGDVVDNIAQDALQNGVTPLNNSALAKTKNANIIWNAANSDSESARVAVSLNPQLDPESLINDSSLKVLITVAWRKDLSRAQYAMLSESKKTSVRLALAHNEAVPISIKKEMHKVETNEEVHRQLKIRIN